MKLLDWNTEWAKPGTARGRRVAERIETETPDAACLTEAYPDIVPRGGHLVSSSGDSGYAGEDGRRKVVLWAREPWRDSWQGEETGLPGGRFVSGVTGGVRFLGLCIPWSMAHVASGRRNRKPWEDHLAYLEALRPILANLRSRPEPLVVTGDWNQRIPRGRQPEVAFRALLEAMAGLEIVTAGTAEALIDHVAVSPGLRHLSLRLIPSRDEAGKPLSDHVGCSLELNPTKP